MIFDTMRSYIPTFLSILFYVTSLRSLVLSAAAASDLRDVVISRSLAARDPQAISARTKNMIPFHSPRNLLLSSLSSSAQSASSPLSPRAIPPTFVTESVRHFREGTVNMVQLKAALDQRLRAFEVGGNIDLGHVEEWAEAHQRRLQQSERIMKQLTDHVAEQERELRAERRLMDAVRMHIAFNTYKDEAGRAYRVSNTLRQRVAIFRQDRRGYFNVT